MQTCIMFLFYFSEDFLVFLTGQEEIETVMSNIKQIAKVSS